MRIAMRILTFVGGAGVGVVLGGFFLGEVGSRLAESTCDPEASDEFLPCLGEAVGGFLAGVAVGGIAGVLGWWLLWRLWTRSNGTPYSALHLLAVTGLGALGIAGCMAVIALLVGSPLAAGLALACVGIVVLARGVRRDARGRSRSQSSGPLF